MPTLSLLIPTPVHHLPSPLQFNSMLVRPSFALPSRVAHASGMSLRGVTSGAMPLSRLTTSLPSARTSPPFATTRPRPSYRTLRHSFHHHRTFPRPLQKPSSTLPALYSRTIAPYGLSTTPTTTWAPCLLFHQLWRLRASRIRAFSTTAVSGPASLPCGTPRPSISQRAFGESTSERSVLPLAMTPHVSRYPLTYLPSSHDSLRSSYVGPVR